MALIAGGELVAGLLQFLLELGDPLITHRQVLMRATPVARQHVADVQVIEIDVGRPRGDRFAGTQIKRWSHRFPPRP